jgi:integrase
MFWINLSSSMQKHPVNPSPTGMRLYDTQGHRLYLTASEREAFRKAAEQAPREVRTYCHTLLYTGCRPSEALALTACCF